MSLFTAIARLVPLLQGGSKILMWQIWNTSIRKVLKNQFKMQEREHVIIN